LPSRLPESQDPVHLSSFALCPAFPDSDYYDDSVAMGLAPGRQSRVSPRTHVRAWVRSSTHPYTQEDFLVSPRADLPSSFGIRMVYEELPYGVSPLRSNTTIAELHHDQQIAAGFCVPRSGLDLKQFSLNLATRVLQSVRCADAPASALPACFGPFILSESRGKPVDPGSLSESLLIG